MVKPFQRHTELQICSRGKSDFERKERGKGCSDHGQLIFLNSFRREISERVKAESRAAVGHSRAEGVPGSCWESFLLIHATLIQLPWLVTRTTNSVLTPFIALNFCHTGRSSLAVYMVLNRVSVYVSPRGLSLSIVKLRLTSLWQLRMAPRAVGV